MQSTEIRSAKEWGEWVSDRRDWDIDFEPYFEPNERTTYPFLVFWCETSPNGYQAVEYRIHRCH